jgi:hypothetical protein
LLGIVWRRRKSLELLRQELPKLREAVFPIFYSPTRKRCKCRSCAARIERQALMPWGPKGYRLAEHTLVIPQRAKAARVGQEVHSPFAFSPKLARLIDHLRGRVFQGRAHCV